MIIVSDTSPITNLIQVNHLFILEKLFHKLIIPETVYAELCEIKLQKTILDGQDWITVTTVTNQQLVTELENELDKGEAESIALALQLQADYLLMDEMRGRNIAEEKGLKIVGLLGILVKAKEKKLLDSVKSLLDRLMNEAGFRIHLSLYNRILELAGEY